MILDILTALFFVGGFVLILMLISERRRDVLHGLTWLKNGATGEARLQRPCMTLIPISPTTR